MNIKYISIGFVLAFFILITIIGLRNCDKPATGHSHVTKPDKVYMGEDYNGK